MGFLWAAYPQTGVKNPRTNYSVRDEGHQRDLGFNMSCIYIIHTQKINGNYNSHFILTQITSAPMWVCENSKKYKHYV